MVTVSSEGREDRVRTRLEGEETTGQLTCTVVSQQWRRSSSRTSTSSHSQRVNILYPSGQQHFASLLRLYLESRGAEVTLGEVGACRRQLVLLPMDTVRCGVESWVEEVRRAASRGERMVAVVEERGEWRRTDPWLEEVEVGDSVLWVHDYQEACVERMVEKLRLGDTELDDEDEDEVEHRRASRRGQELWGTLRKTFLRKRTISVDSGYTSS